MSASQDGRHDLSWRQSLPELPLVLDVADVLDFHRGRRFALWHDSAVFHFLTELDDYRAFLERAGNQPATS